MIDINTKINTNSAQIRNTLMWRQKYERIFLKNLSIRMDRSTEEDAASKNQLTSLPKEDEMTSKSEDNGKGVKEGVSKASACSKFQKLILGSFQKFFMAWVSRGLNIT